MRYEPCSIASISPLTAHVFGWHRIFRRTDALGGSREALFKTRWQMTPLPSMRCSAAVAGVVGVLAAP